MNFFSENASTHGFSSYDLSEVPKTEKWNDVSIIIILLKLVMVRQQ